MARSEGLSIDPMGSTLPHRTWREVPRARSEEILHLLLRCGGLRDHDVRGQSEIWRVRYAGATFTAYASGTLYCSGGDAPELPFLYGQIDELVAHPARTSAP
ncbi:MAG: hypothetical protein KGJ23_11930 [Euryarchaeota archaeon]|nr:hypothetical protein [Euryarchaeota archaeon]MDE1837305.1 hypothetical protein [Euryarchaeota archaeon]MDE1879823.1 hypothetical protein [Euryarchaeota archaeon]MDE2045264.1 hypothetical protein [Thermoplasmata archaeon]